MSNRNVKPPRNGGKSLSATLGKPTPFDPVSVVCSDYFPHLDPDIPRILIAAWLGNHDALGFDDPCWLALIAPSSTLKTGLLVALSDATGGYILDTLTPQTFSSGLRLGRKKGFGLLQHLGAHPNIVIKDLSAILSKRSDHREELLGQLRCIYDGEFARPTGTGASDEMARWRGRATIIVGMTPAIDLYHALSNQLGERFIQARFAITEKDVVDVAGQALENSAGGLQQREVLTEAFRKAIGLAHLHLNRNVLTPALRLRLQNLVAFVTKARTGVVRDHSGYVVQPPAPEGPGRLTKQLAALACGLAALRGTKALTEEDYHLVERVAFDSIPETRSKILWALYNHDARVTADFRKLIRVSDPTIRRHLEDLGWLGLAVQSVLTEQAKRSEPSRLGLNYLKAARGEQATRKAKLGGDISENSVTGPYSPPKSDFRVSEQPVGANVQVSDPEVARSGADDEGRA